MRKRSFVIGILLLVLALGSIGFAYGYGPGRGLSNFESYDEMLTFRNERLEEAFEQGLISEAFYQSMLDNPGFHMGYFLTDEERLEWFDFMEEQHESYNFNRPYFGRGPGFRGCH